MSTLKDNFDKAEKEVRHSVEEAGRDIKHQFKDNERDPGADVKKEEAEKGTLWQQLKDKASSAESSVSDTLKEVRDDIKQQLNNSDGVTSHDDSQKDVEHDNILSQEALPGEAAWQVDEL